MSYTNGQGETSGDETSEVGGEDVRSSLAEIEGKYISFRLRDENYAVQILRVRELLGEMNITPVPRSNPAVRGVINLRGKVIPVVDLRRKFAMQRLERTELSGIIVVQHRCVAGTRLAGLFVDEVLEVLHLGASQIGPRPELGERSSSAEFVTAVGRVDERVYFVLDIDSVLADANYRMGNATPEVTTVG